MGEREGKWWLGERHPTLEGKPWIWVPMQPQPKIVDLWRLFDWAAQGKHVRLEYVPDGGEPGGNGGNPE